MRCGQSPGCSKAVVVCARGVWITVQTNCTALLGLVSALQYHDAAAVLPGLGCHLKESHPSVANHKGHAIV